MVLSRVTGKVFAGEAPDNEIGVFGSAKNNDATLSSDIATIQNYSNNAYSLGWGSGIVSSENYPPMEEVNGVLKTISYQACYLLQEGIPAYDIGTEYSATSLVKNWSGTTLEIYISLVDGIIGNPLTDASKWVRAEVISNTPRIDGQWIINVQQQVVNNLNLHNSNNTPYTVDLSNYLPNDGYNYEVIIDGQMMTGDVSGRYCAFIVRTAYGYGIYLGNGRPRTNASVKAAGNGIIVVGTDRKLYIARTDSYYGTATLNLKGYRRIGTNA